VLAALTNNECPSSAPVHFGCLDELRLRWHDTDQEFGIAAGEHNRGKGHPIL
jgi:hypothetical protein